MKEIGYYPKLMVVYVKLEIPSTISRSEDSFKDAMEATSQT